MPWNTTWHELGGNRLGVPVDKALHGLACQRLSAARQRVGLAAQAQPRNAYFAVEEEAGVFGAAADHSLHWDIAAYACAFDLASGNAFGSFEVVQLFEGESIAEVAGLDGEVAVLLESLSVST